MVMIIITNKKKILYTILSFLIFFAMFIIHEIGHLIIIFIFDIPVDGIYFNPLILKLSIDVNNSANHFHFFISGMFGSIFGVSMGIITIMINKNKYIEIPIKFYIIYELIYWSISPFLGHGDGYAVLVWYLNLSMFLLYSSSIIFIFTAVILVWVWT